MYVTNSGNNTVSVCALDPASGGLLTDCYITADGFNQPYGIAIYAGHAYVTNNAFGVGVGTVTLCDVNAGTGALVCAPTPSGVIFENEPTSGIAVADGVAFVSSTYPSGNIYACSVDPTTGELLGPPVQGSAGGNPTGMAVRENYLFYPIDVANPYADTAYVRKNLLLPGPTFATNLEAMEIFVGKSPNSYVFSFPKDLVFFGDSLEYALVTSSGDNTVVLCDIIPLESVDALLSNCAVTGSGFDAPIGIVVVSP